MKFNCYKNGKDYSQMSKEELLKVIEGLEEEIWGLREELSQMGHQRYMEKSDFEKREKEREFSEHFPFFKNKFFGEK
ncbi:hypothetical protein [Mesobacillus maritimus]|uniref:hypothetical protein n=1 Tax=Mesobacillus maritimus TaxID=1643336 RepID=UPI00384C1A0D